MMLNPFAAIIQQSRHAFIAPSHPSAYEVAGPWLIGTVVVFVGVIALGYRVFARRAPTIAEQL
jgi:ABC-2 type transport system permease protein